jgi:hypothetical protein
MVDLTLDKGTTMIKDIQSAPVFHQMVFSAWIRRTVDRLKNGYRDYNTGVYYFPVANPEKHLGKASKIYNRFKNIIDMYW